MAGGATQADRPALPAKFRYHAPIGQHRLVAAVACNFDVAPVPGEVVEGADDLAAHSPIGTDRERNAMLASAAPTCCNMSLGGRGTMARKRRRSRTAELAELRSLGWRALAAFTLLGLMYVVFVVFQDQTLWLIHKLIFERMMPE